MPFTRENKGAIDLLLPAVLSGYVAYRFYGKKGKSDWKAIAIPAAIAFVLSYIIVSQLTKALLNKAARPDDITGAVDTPTPIGSGSAGDTTGAGFNAKPFTDRLYDDIECNICLRDQQLYKDVAALSNAQLQAIYNDWNARYYSKNSETLTQAMEGEWYGFTDLVLKGIATNIKDRLRKLGAN